MNVNDLSSIDALLETWTINARINLYLLEAVDDAALGASAAPRGRTVFSLFAHIHNARLMWLKSAAPELLVGVDKIEPNGPPSKAPLSSGLANSAVAIEGLLRSALESNGRVKGFKPHAVAFLGYLVSHESHHRGQIETILRLNGSPIPDAVSYGLWEWGVR